MSELPSSTPVLITNVVLAAFVLLALAAVVGGAIYEVATRRRLRASLPDGWPPEPEVPAAGAPRTSARSRAVRA